MHDAEKSNILVVDDLPEKLLAYESILQDLDQNIVLARSGEEALAQILRSDFAVVLLDVNMPGLSGLETASLIRKRRKSAHTPIIFLTAFSDEVRAAEGYAHGAVDYISTPVIPDILRAKVKVFVDLYRMAQQVRRQAEERIVLAQERMRREAAEEANRRLELLARAGEILGHSLDYLVTARDVVQLPIPVLGDAALLVIPRLRTREWIVLQCQQGDAGLVVEEYSGLDAISPELTPIVDTVLAGGTVSWPDDATAVLPIRAQGKVFGLLILSKRIEGPGFSVQDRTVADAFIDRAAISLENARLYEEVENADRQKNEFLSMLAHELRNPLAPIRNAAEVLRLKGTDDPQIRAARDVIDRQLSHMVRLVDDLLDVSRITRGKIQLRLAPTNLIGVVSHALEASQPLIESAGHRVESSLPTEPLWVEGDADRLIQVVTNLLNNAAKYTHPGGQIWLALQNDDSHAIIRVRDTGIGIPPEMLGSVFDLFAQVDRSLNRAQGGLGIGLTVVSRLITKHGGTVVARSDGPGMGSEFIVRLPMISAPAGKSGSSGGGEVALRGRGLSLLLVDDNADGAESLAVLLRFMGHKVDLAYDGPAALAAAVTSRPHAVILDIGLPGMNGYEVARHLRDRPETRDLLLIALTGYGRDEDRQKSNDAGFDHHLVKPVELDVLRQLLERVAIQTEAAVGS